MRYKKLFYPEISSTRDVARQIIQEGEEECFVVVAEKQVSGRGRGKRIWHSPPGGLYLSIAIPSPEITEKGLSFLSAWVVARSIKDETAITPRVKWPNDILIQNKKVSGILVEKGKGKKDFSLIGMGINLNSRKEDFPASLRKKIVSLKDIAGKEIHSERFLDLLLDNFFHGLKLLKERGFSYILNKWLEFSLPLGEPIAFHAASRIIKGLYWGVGREGELYIRTTEGRILSFEEGEIINN
ncbi:MAG: biotin--[acetyl-CoA-carboxylase] ligase [Caldiserica bacterium]|nr:biotin--[acetyl-CoA-carboxylase] ligase [Caldisericota bacterium]